MKNDPGKQSAPDRETTDPRYRWNLEAMYPSKEAWDLDFTRIPAMADAFARHQGRLGESAEALLSAMKDRDALWQTAERVYVYARMRRDQDNREEEAQSMTDACSSMLARVSAAVSFFTPELLSLPQSRIEGFLEESAPLSVYAFALRDMFREKDHVLSPAEEALMARYSQLNGATNDIFTMLNNADMTFDPVSDSRGSEEVLTHGTFIGLMERRDRTLRKNAFEAMYRPYIRQINTIAAAYSYNTKTDTVLADIRKYPSSAEASLFRDNVPFSVYRNLVDTINENLPVLHRYYGLRKKLLQVDELHMYDVYVPLIPVPEREIPFEEAVEIMKKGLGVLGDEYRARMEQGIRDRWIDVYENQGKTSGAYSFGSYDSMPYILLNYTGKLKDVFTLTHEMGHSMHSSFTRETQPFIYGGHSIFTAEVASTVNESLLVRDLLARETDPEQKKYLLNLYIEEFRSTVFRQTMFAEFELKTHEAAEKGQALTAPWLCREYEALVEKYFGPGVVRDREIRYEWARIPHFYNAFYVYKYATGFSAATAISRRILEEGAPAVSDYIRFLRSGESDHPIELLKLAGVDMNRPEPVRQAMETFASMVAELEALTS